MLEVDYHPICIRTIDLLWITVGGGCVSDKKQMMKLNKLSCQESTSTVLCLCDGIVVCFVICLLEEFIGKPHILSHVLSD